MKSLLVQKIIATEAMGDHAFFETKGRVYTFLNPVSYLDALERKELFGRFDGIFADGSLLVAAIRMVYGKRVTRRSCDMTSIGRQLLEVKKAVDMLKKQYPKANIIGYRDGYFANEQEMVQEARYITALNPDFLVVGMGAIKQENFLLRVKAAGYQGIGFTCGGFIHQTAHSEKDYYPEWADRMNLRFLYRMWREPHTRKRYLVAGIIFPARFVWERFFG